MPLKIDYAPRTQKLLKKLPAKHAKQILGKIQALAVNPQPQDIRQLKGFTGVFWSADSGEYRIIYEYDETALTVHLIGHRNDGDVYRSADRILN